MILRNSTDERLVAVLCDAAWRGDADATRGALADGAPPGGTIPPGRFALQIAASGGHVEIVRQLLDAGADPNQVDPNGHSALHEAVDGAIEAGKYAFDVEGRVEEPRTDVVRLLLARGADPFASNHRGDTPRDWAARAGPKPSIPLLAAFDELERRFEFLLSRADHAELVLPTRGWDETLRPSSTEVERVDDAVHRIVGRGIDVSFSLEEVGLHVCVRAAPFAAPRVVGWVQEIADNIQAAIGAALRIATIRADV